MGQWVLLVLPERQAVELSCTHNHPLSAHLLPPLSYHFVFSVTISAHIQPLNNQLCPSLSSLHTLFLYQHTYPDEPKQAKNGLTMSLTPAHSWHHTPILEQRKKTSGVCMCVFVWLISVASLEAVTSRSSSSQVQPFVRVTIKKISVYSSRKSF